MFDLLLKHAFNLGLRGITILLRFALVFGLGKYYSTEDLGVYGLFNTTITIVIFFLGFDFYAYAHREILKAQKPQQVTYLLNSLAFFAITYLVVLPVCLVVFFAGVLPVEYIAWFYIIVTFEHIGQELYRLFILYDKQLFANILLTIRMASWIVPVVGYWVVADFKELRLEPIFWMWISGQAVAIIVGVIGLRRYYKGVGRTGPIDWYWIKRGIPVASQFLVGTIAYKIIEFSDRYFLDYYLDKTAVGVYTFYYNFANLLQTLVFTIVIAQLYPKLAEYYGNNEMDKYNEYKKSFTRQVFWVSIGSSVLVLLAIIPAIEIVGKQEFYDNFLTYGLLVFAITLLNLSFIPHYILYAVGKDRIIMVSTIVCALVNVTSNLIITPRLGLAGSALSTVISYFVLMIIKFFYAK
jgi:O-antigen/teichoic acid export membrane protein